MKPIYRELIVAFLREYSDRLGNDGCNDWEWPADWTEGDRRFFIAEAIAYNEGRPVDTVTLGDVDRQGKHLPNHWAVDTLAAILERE